MGRERSKDRKETSRREEKRGGSKERERGNRDDRGSRDIRKDDNRDSSNNKGYKGSWGDGGKGYGKNSWGKGSYKDTGGGGRTDYAYNWGYNSKGKGKEDRMGGWRSLWDPRSNARNPDLEAEKAGRPFGGVGRYSLHDDRGEGGAPEPRKQDDSPAGGTWSHDLFD